MSAFFTYRNVDTTFTAVKADAMLNGGDQSEQVGRLIPR